MFKPAPNDDTLADLLSQTKKNLTDWQQLCDKIAQLPNKTADQKNVDNNYKALLQQAVSQLTKLQQSAPTDEIPQAPSP